MTSTEPHATFHRQCGEILGISLSTEKCIENFILHYFFEKMTMKMHVFKDKILYQMNFERKIDLFKGICKYNKISDDAIEKVVQDINFVKDVRNKIAHYESIYEGPSKYFGDAKIILWRKKSTVVRGKDSLEVTEKLLQEIVERYFSVMKGIAEVHNRLIMLEKNR